MEILVIHLCAFLAGSIPVGYLVGKAKGVDVRSAGSGNTGATNLCRTLGKKAGLITLVGDIFKGALAVVICGTFIPSSTAIDPQVIRGTIGLAAVFGHCFSPFLGFKGGKGVAASLGAFLVVAPLQVTAATACFFLVFLATRYVSLGSIASAVAFPVFLYLFPPAKDLFLVGLAAGLLVIYRHSANIKRLLAGTENRFGKRRDD